SLKRKPTRIFFSFTYPVSVLRELTTRGYCPPLPQDTSLAGRGKGPTTQLARKRSFHRIFAFQRCVVLQLERHALYLRANRKFDSLPLDAARHLRLAYKHRRVVAAQLLAVLLQRQRGHARAR